jgi:hypothetical protein
MAVTLTTTTADFIVTRDRAEHIVVEKVDDNGNVVQGYDFGITGEVVLTVDSWLDMDDATARGILAPAMNAYLLAEIAKRF